MVSGRATNKLHSSLLLGWLRIQKDKMRCPVLLKYTVSDTKQALKGLDGWMDGWMNEWMNGQVNGWSSGQLEGGSYLVPLVSPIVL